MITGGVGFIGSNLAHALVKLKAKVLIIDSLCPLYGGNVFNVKGIEDKCKVMVRDVRDRSLMNSLVKYQDFIFNLGSDKPISVFDIAKLIVELSKSGKIKQIPFSEKNKKVEIGDYYANCAKIKKMLGWKPMVSLKDGLRMTIEYYKKNKRCYWK